MRLWQILLIVPVVVFLCLARQIGDLGRNPAKDTPAQRTLRRSIYAILALLILAALYAAVHDAVLRAR